MVEKTIDIKAEDEFDGVLIPENFEDTNFENVVPQFDACGATSDLN